MGDDDVRGMGEAKAMAEAGMKLFASDAAAEVDTAGAEAFKADFETKLAAMEAEVATLTGKDNKKAQTEKKKEVSAAKNDKQYIDACKVVKGLEPKNGFFVKAAAAAAPAAKAAEPAAAAAEEAKEDKKKDDKKPKKTENAGLGPDEKKELEKLKTDLIARKGELKAQGMSGGQMNKDEQVVEWVKRMTELKEKENPGSTTTDKGADKKSSKKALSSEASAEKAKLEQEIEEYRNKLKSEFGYSAKDIKADPDMADMQKKLDAIK
jgi:hypothetical protein